MESRRLDDEPQITAQPKPITDELMSNPVTEPGLSVDPEDLGRQFLSEATEQSNFESSMGGDTPEMYANAPALSDDPLTGANWEQDRSVWQHTVELSLQSGSIDEARAQGSPEGTEQNQGIDDESDEDDDQVDVVSSSIHDASLFDHETDRPGEVESPTVQTDEQEKNTKQREAAARDDMTATRRIGGRGEAGRLRRRAAHAAKG